MKIGNRIEGPQDLKGLTQEELKKLSQECRERITETITKRGGHLASNLGVVELTLALHRGFESPKDKIVWDTSNQCYTHKLVTGRWDRFPTVRTPGGLSGFAEPKESPHDTLAAGHAGTGLSYALGMSMAFQDDPASPYVVSIVGDGALTAGLSYEALNNIVHLKPKRLVVVFNDNGWSISENIGWLVHYRNRLFFNPGYRDLLKRGQRLFEYLPKGAQAWWTLRKIKTTLEGFFFPNVVWEELGFHYVGPLDGHSFEELEEGLAQAKEISKDGTPTVLHVLTHKGKGYKAAEENPVKFHQPSTPAASVDGTTRYTYSQVFAQTLIRMMGEDPKIVAISAAMLEGTALSEVRKRFPRRVFDVGIAEQHAVTMAAGMAKAGLKPVVAIYSTFLQRSFDQLVHDVCLQSLPVTVCVDRAGLIGDDGKTHQGVFDIAYTRCLPNMVVAAPKDENELQHMLYTAIRSGRPFAVRYPRGMGVGVPLDQDLRELPIGKAEVLRKGEDLALVAYGSMVPVAEGAAAMLAEHGIRCGVVNARFAKPLDLETLIQAAKSSGRILTLEEHLLMGGFGSAVLEALQDRTDVCARCHGIPDQFIEQAPQPAQRAAFGLDTNGVVRKVRDLFPEIFGRDLSEPSETEKSGASEKVTW